MLPRLALLLCFLFVLWLFVAERKRRPRISAATWIPFLWAIIVGSRPLTAWLGVEQSFQTVDASLEGSPFDRAVFLGLIVAGITVLSRRNHVWKRFVVANRWVAIFFVYLGLSALWSDYAFVSFKRWVKDFGNLVMALVILSEEDPAEAVETLLERCASVLIPMSVLVVKYYPEIGRYYDRWTYKPYYRGVATDKNMLGMTLFVCGLFLVGRLLTVWRPIPGCKDKAVMYRYAVAALLAMNFWLLYRVHSSTALTCTILGAAVLLALRIPAVRKRVDRVGLYAAGAVILLAVLNASVNMGEVMLGVLGRDMTLTGRTDIWQAVLREDVNPLCGVGYYSFWMGDRVDRLSRSYAFALNEAHNGYLETYLNSGLIGFGLLLAMLAAATRRIRRAVAAGSSHGALCFAFVVVIFVYAMTEALYNRLNLVWFALLLMAVDCRPVRSGSSVAPRPGQGDCGASAPDAWRWHEIC